MLMTTICYKLNTPVVYNKGTRFETTEDTFLHCYMRGTHEEVQRVVDTLNTEVNDRVYFVDEQEVFDTMGD